MTGERCPGGGEPRNIIVRREASKGTSSLTHPLSQIGPDAEQRGPMDNGKLG